MIKHGVPPFIVNCQDELVFKKNKKNMNTEESTLSTQVGDSFPQSPLELNATKEYESARNASHEEYVAAKNSHRIADIRKEGAKDYNSECKDESLLDMEDEENESTIVYNFEDNNKQDFDDSGSCSHILDSLQENTFQERVENYFSQSIYQQKLTDTEIVRSPSLQDVTCYIKETDQAEIVRSPSFQDVTCNIKETDQAEIVRSRSLQDVTCNIKETDQAEIIRSRSLQDVTCNIKETDQAEIVRSPSFQDVKCNIKETDQAEIVRSRSLQDVTCNIIETDQAEIVRSPSLQDVTCNIIETDQAEIVRSRSLQDVACNIKETDQAEIVRSPSLQDVTCNITETAQAEVTLNNVLKKLCPSGLNERLHKFKRNTPLGASMCFTHSYDSELSTLNEPINMVPLTISEQLNASCNTDLSNPTVLSKCDFKCIGGISSKDNILTQTQSIESNAQLSVQNRSENIQVSTFKNNVNESNSNMIKCQNITHCSTETCPLQYRDKEMTKRQKDPSNEKKMFTKSRELSPSSDISGTKSEPFVRNYCIKDFRAIDTRLHQEYDLINYASGEYVLKHLKKRVHDDVTYVSNRKKDQTICSPGVSEVSSVHGESTVSRTKSYCNLISSESDYLSEVNLNKRNACLPMNSETFMGKKTISKETKLNRNPSDMCSSLNAHNGINEINKGIRDCDSIDSFYREPTYLNLKPNLTYKKDVNLDGVLPLKQCDKHTDHETSIHPVTYSVKSNNLKCVKRKKLHFTKQKTFQQNRSKIESCKFLKHSNIAINRKHPDVSQLRLKMLQKRANKNIKSSFFKTVSWLSKYRPGLTCRKACLEKRKKYKKNIKSNCNEWKESVRRPTKLPVNNKYLGKVAQRSKKDTSNAKYVDDISTKKCLTIGNQVETLKNKILTSESDRNSDNVNKQIEVGKSRSSNLKRHCVEIKCKLPKPKTVAVVRRKKVKFLSTSVPTITSFDPHFKTPLEDLCTAAESCIQEKKETSEIIHIKHSESSNFNPSKTILIGHCCSELSQSDTVIEEYNDVENVITSTANQCTVTDVSSEPLVEEYNDHVDDSKYIETERTVQGVPYETFVDENHVNDSKSTENECTSQGISNETLVEDYHVNGTNSVENKYAIQSVSGETSGDECHDHVNDTKPTVNECAIPGDSSEYHDHVNDAKSIECAVKAASYETVVDEYNNKVNDTKPTVNDCVVPDILSESLVNEYGNHVKDTKSTEKEYVFQGVSGMTLVEKCPDHMNDTTLTEYQSTDQDVSNESFVEKYDHINDKKSTENKCFSVETFVHRKCTENKYTVQGVSSETLSDKYDQVYDTQCTANKCSVTNDSSGTLVEDDHDEVSDTKPPEIKCAVSFGLISETAENKKNCDLLANGLKKDPSLCALPGKCQKNGNLCEHLQDVWKENYHHLTNKKLEDRKITMGIPVVMLKRVDSPTPIQNHIGNCVQEMAKAKRRNSAHMNENFLFKKDPTDNNIKMKNQSDKLPELIKEKQYKVTRNSREDLRLCCGVTRTRKKKWSSDSEHIYDIPSKIQKCQVLSPDIPVLTRENVQDKICSEDYDKQDCSLFNTGANPKDPHKKLNNCLSVVDVNDDHKEIGSIELELKEQQSDMFESTQRKEMINNNMYGMESNCGQDNIVMEPNVKDTCDTFTESITDTDINKSLKKRKLSSCNKKMKKMKKKIMPKVILKESKLIVESTTSVSSASPASSPMRENSGETKSFLPLPFAEPRIVGSSCYNMSAPSFLDIPCKTEQFSFASANRYPKLLMPCGESNIDFGELSPPPLTKFSSKGVKKTLLKSPYASVVLMETQPKLATTKLTKTLTEDEIHESSDAQSNTKQKSSSHLNDLKIVLRDGTTEKEQSEELEEITSPVSSKSFGVESEKLLDKTEDVSRQPEDVKKTDAVSFKKNETVTKRVTRQSKKKENMEKGIEISASMDGESASSSNILNDVISNGTDTIVVSKSENIAKGFFKAAESNNVISNGTDTSAVCKSEKIANGFFSSAESSKVFADYQKNNYSDVSSNSLLKTADYENCLNVHKTKKKPAKQRRRKVKKAQPGVLSSKLDCLAKEDNMRLMLKKIDKTLETDDYNIVFKDKLTARLQPKVKDIEKQCDQAVNRYFDPLTISVNDDNTVRPGILKSLTSPTEDISTLSEHLAKHSIDDSGQKRWNECAVAELNIPPNSPISVSSKFLDISSDSEYESEHENPIVPLHIIDKNSSSCSSLASPRSTINPFAPKSWSGDQLSHGESQSEKVPDKVRNKRFRKTRSKATNNSGLDQGTEADIDSDGESVIPPSYNNVIKNKSPFNEKSHGFNTGLINAECSTTMLSPQSQVSLMPSPEGHTYSHSLGIVITNAYTLHSENVFSNCNENIISETTIITGDMDEKLLDTSTRKEKTESANQTEDFSDGNSSCYYKSCSDNTGSSENDAAALDQRLFAFNFIKKVKNGYQCLVCSNPDRPTVKEDIVTALSHVIKLHCRCEECDEIYFEVYAFQGHVWSVHAENKALAREVKLLTRRHSAEPCTTPPPLIECIGQVMQSATYICLICDRRYTNRSEVKTHVAKAHFKKAYTLTVLANKKKISAASNPSKRSISMKPTAGNSSRKRMKNKN